MSAPPRVLLCGYPSSGNYLTLLVLMALQRANGCWRSLREESGLGETLRRHVPPELMQFPEITEVDCIRDGRIQTPLAKLEGSIDLVFDVSSLVWTHDRPTAVRRQEGRQPVYVVRDGRDAITSLLHRRCSERERRLYPKYRIDDPGELARRPGYFERLVREWADHVRAMQARAGWHVVHYEHLCGGEKPDTIRALARVLGLRLTDDLLAEILERTAPRRARTHAQAHVRRASPGGHRGLFTPEMEETYARIAGPAHLSLGYSLEPAAAPRRSA